MEGLDRPGAVGVGDLTGVKRSGSPKYNECGKAQRTAWVVDPKSGSPLLFLSLEEGGYRLYSPEEDKVYETKGDFSGYRFLASSGKRFLVLDSECDLYIIDVLSEEKIRLPPLESIKGNLYKVERVGDGKFHDTLMGNGTGFFQAAQDLRGHLWVDDKNGDYVVAWRFERCEYIRFYKKGEDHYREIPTGRNSVIRELQGQKDMVLKGYNLYVRTTRDFIRHLDLSGKDGFQDVSVKHRFPMCMPCRPKDETQANKVISYSYKIAVTTSGEVLFVYTKAWESTTFQMHRIFHVYKRDPKDLDPKTYDTQLVEVDSLGDDALFLDLGITVPAHHTLGIDPNSIYFSRDDPLGYKERPSCLDICVYNLATKTTKRFSTLYSNLKLKDAHWFLSS